MSPLTAILRATSLGIRREKCGDKRAPSLFLCRW